MAFECFYEDLNGYSCFVRDREIPSEVNEDFFKGDHYEGCNNDDVEVVDFLNLRIEKIPNAIGIIFKNITKVAIENCNLKEIWKENLQQFPNLKELNLEANQLEYLPGDLFNFNKKLKNIHLSHNKIKFIGPELLDGLPNLANIFLRCNVNINSGYYKLNPEFPLNRLKEEIRSKCKPPPELLPEKTKNKKKRSRGKAKQNNDYKNLHKDLDKFISLENFKDFTIKVDSKDFKVHKFIFMARSPTFAEMIKNNPDADELVLTDIPVEVFESILDFVYTDKPQRNSANTLKIFAVAKKLKIESLVDILLETMMKKIEEEENLDCLWEIFSFGAKVECTKLRMKAFERIKKHFPDKRLKNDPIKVKIAIEARKSLDLVTENIENLEI